MNNNASNKMPQENHGHVIIYTFYTIFTMSWICTLVWSTNDLGTFQPTLCFKHTQMLIICYFTFHWYLLISNLISMFILHTYNKKIMMGLSHRKAVACDATSIKKWQECIVIAPLNTIPLQSLLIFLEFGHILHFLYPSFCCIH
jgi:hypothetical protein